MSKVPIGTTAGTINPAHIGSTTCHALIDTAGTKICMSESCYQTLMLPNLNHLHNILVRSASVGHLYPMATVTCTFHLGKQTFTYNLIVFKNSARPFILGLDFLRT